jgi:hypothetical protein
MRINQAKRIFMNEADAGSGNGAAPAPAAPAEPAAPTPAPALDVDVLLSRLSGVIDEKITASQNATHAALRKAGVFKQEKPAGEPAATSQPSQSAPAVVQAGMTQAEMDARMDARLELERVIATREGKHGLNEAQSKRLRSALGGVSRESLAAEADSYLADMGLVKAPATPPQPAATQAPATAPAKPNVSDRGAAAPSDNRDHNGVLNSRPLEMTGHDIEALMLQHGEDKGLAEFQAHALRALSKMKIRPPRG